MRQTRKKCTKKIFACCSKIWFSMMNRRRLTIMTDTQRTNTSCDNCLLSFNFLLTLSSITFMLAFFYMCWIELIAWRKSEKWKMLRENENDVLYIRSVKRFLCTLPSSSWIAWFFFERFCNFSLTSFHGIFLHITFFPILWTHFFIHSCRLSSPCHAYYSFHRLHSISAFSHAACMR